MKYEIRADAQLGRLLWLSDGKTELAATLDTGIRIVHLSCCGMENLFYRQPADLSDGIFRDHGWKLIGGHRFWLSPETEESYWREGEEIEYTLHENGVTLRQKTDPWIGMEKAIRLDFLSDGGIRVEHSACNRTEKPLTWALWGINTLAGGRGEVEFTGSGDYTPMRTVSLWRKTSLSDPRLSFTADRVQATHAPMAEYCKIGVYSPSGKVCHENLGQRFEIQMEPVPMELCPDRGVNVEIYLNKRFMELETLGPMTTIAPDQWASFQEVWRVEVAD